jgi:hypothetical protein
VSKSLPGVILLIAPLSLFGCEPVVASVAQVTPLNPETSVRDAGMRPVRDQDGALVFSELDDPEGCVVLTDQTLPEVIEDAAAAPQRLVVGRTGVAAGCVGPDAGVVLLNASVFRRRDNQPMVEQGVTYSYRWDVTTTIMTTVNLVGGDSICESKPVVFRPHGYLFPGTSAVGTSPASCYQFNSPIDALYLRTTGGDYVDTGWLNLGKTPALLKLCRAECPPGTEHFFDDAGMPPATP